MGNKHFEQAFRDYGFCRCQFTFLFVCFLFLMTECPENFGLQNYSSITSVCKAPEYNKTLCCSSFTMFTCRFLTYFNDPSTNCASTLFTYLNLAGNYPPGLFANLCTQGDQQGIPCPITPAPTPNPSSALSLIRPCQSSLASSVLFSAFVLAVVMIT